MANRTFWLFLVAAGLSPVLAYRPAVDTAGPLTARIEGPERITRTDSPVQLTVVLENSAEEVLSGQVQVRGIDRWQVTPQGNLPFSLPAKGSARLVFSVRPAEVTFNAHYPIHAFAEFEWQGKTQRAHPILVVPIQLENPPRPDLPSGWKAPVAAPAVAPAAVFPPQGRSRALGSAGEYQVRVWPGRRGLLDATIGFQQGSRRLYFRGFQIKVLGAALNDPGSGITLAQAREESVAGRYRVRHRFESPAGPFDLLTETWVEKSALRTRFSLVNAKQRPWVHLHLEDVAMGPWSQQAKRIYAGPGNVMQDPQKFRLK
jgi:hypothetical protein